MNKVLPFCFCLLGLPFARAQVDQFVPVRIELAVTRHDGTAAPERLEHALYVIANRKGMTELRLGREIAVGEQYRNVGTNIHCRAETHGDQFLVFVVLEQSTHPCNREGRPFFDTINFENQFVLSDGETLELVTASSQGSDETWKLGVTLEVLR